MLLHLIRENQALHAFVQLQTSFTQVGLSTREAAVIKAYQLHDQNLAF